MTIAIYHNPECGTSRNVLAIITAIGEKSVVIDYRKEGWTGRQLLGLFAAADLTPRSALRIKNSPAEDLGLLDPAVDDRTLMSAMVEHPILVNRPIVCSPKGVRLCRPSEAVFELLDRLPLVPFYKEDGDLIIDQRGQRVV